MVIAKSRQVRLAGRWLTLPLILIILGSSGLASEDVPLPEVPSSMAQAGFKLFYARLNQEEGRVLLVGSSRWSFPLPAGSQATPQVAESAIKDWLVSLDRQIQNYPTWIQDLNQYSDSEAGDKHRAQEALIQLNHLASLWLPDSARLEISDAAQNAALRFPELAKDVARLILLDSQPLTQSVDTSKENLSPLLSREKQEAIDQDLAIPTFLSAQDLVLARPRVGEGFLKRTYTFAKALNETPSDDLAQVSEDLGEIHKVLRQALEISALRLKSQATQRKQALEAHQLVRNRKRRNQSYQLIIEFLKSLDRTHGLMESTLPEDLLATAEGQEALRALAERLERTSTDHPPLSPPAAMEALKKWVNTQRAALESSPDPSTSPAESGK